MEQLFTWFSHLMSQTKTPKLWAWSSIEEMLSLQLAITGAAITSCDWYFVSTLNDMKPTRRIITFWAESVFHWMIQKRGQTVIVCYVLRGSMTQIMMHNFSYFFYVLQYILID